MIITIVSTLMIMLGYFHSNFFIHFYPELKSVDRSHFFGYNKKGHIMHFIIYISVCVALALGLGLLLS